MTVGHHLDRARQMAAQQRLQRKSSGGGTGSTRRWQLSDGQLIAVAVGGTVSAWVSFAAVCLLQGG